MVRWRSSCTRSVGRVNYTGLVGHGKEFELYPKFKRKLLKWFEHMLRGECNAGIQE